MGSCFPIDAAVPDGGEQRTTIPCNCSTYCPSELPTCDPIAHVCTGCISDQNVCAPGMTCDDATHRCVPKPDGGAECKGNTDCPPIGEVSQRSLCNKATGTCVECLTSSDCGEPKPTCDNGKNLGPPDAGQVPTYRCVDPCQLCIPPEPVCDRPNMRCLPLMDGGTTD